MTFDWSVLVGAIWSVALLVIGALIKGWLERKPRLTYYASHWSAYPRPGPPPVTMHTHGIVIKNVGRKAATDVRLRHELRPETFYHRLVPQEEVAVSYMHTQPFNNFRGQITHGDGVAVEVSAIPIPQYPNWFMRLQMVLATIGSIALVALAIVLGRHAMARWG